MIRFRAVTLIAFGLAGLIGSASVGRADDRKEIDALYNRVAKAMMAKDVNAIVSTATKDFTYTDRGKTSTGSQVVAQLKQQFQTVKGPIKCKMTVITCKITGKTASVIASDTSEMNVPGKDGKSHVVSSSGKAKGALVKTEKGWLMKSVTILSNALTMDGKPFDPSKAMPDHK